MVFLLVYITKALEEDWKTSKGAACEKLALGKYSLKNQCSQILDALDRAASIA